MPEAVVAMVEAQPALAACMEACMEVVQVLVLLKVEEVEHAVEPKERIAELAASAAAEAVQVLAACPMWAQARVRTSRRQHTSMSWCSARGSGVRPHPPRAVGSHARRILQEMLTPGKHLQEDYDHDGGSK